VPASLVTYYIVDNRLGRPLDRSVQAQKGRARRATALPQPCVRLGRARKEDPLSRTGAMARDKTTSAAGPAEKTSRSCAAFSLAMYDDGCNWPCRLLDRSVQAQRRRASVPDVPGKGGFCRRQEQWRGARRSAQLRPTKRLHACSAGVCCDMLHG